MTTAKRHYSDDVPEDIVERLRQLCLVLPEAYEQKAWVGTRWMVRKRSFAHVLSVEVDGADPALVLSFRSSGDELEVLRHTGHPFFMLGWGREAVGMVLDGDTDWDEVSELVTESFCVLAPRKLAALVLRPGAD